jgi:hypothetical protein
MSATAEPTPTEPTGSHTFAIGELLNELANDLEVLGSELCSDYALVARHLGALQAIDLIAQKQKALASVLIAECPADAIRNINLDIFAEKLLAAVGDIH